MNKNATVVVFKPVHNPMAFGKNLNSKISCTNSADLNRNMNRNLSLIELLRELLSRETTMMAQMLISTDKFRQWSTSKQQFTSY